MGTPQMATKTETDLLSCLKMARGVIQSSQRVITYNLESMLKLALTRQIEQDIERIMGNTKKVDAVVNAEIDRCIANAEAETA